MDKFKKNDEIKELLKSVGFSSVEVHEDGNWVKFVGQK